MQGKARIPDFTHQDVLDALKYNPATGVFKWKIRPSKNIAPGSQAGGNLKGNGYRYISFRGYELTEGRLAWFYVTGKWPERRIRYKNGKTNDSRFENMTLFNGIGGEYDYKTREGRNQYLRQYRKASPELEKARALRADFGISLEKYSQMLEAQIGLCAICKQPETHKRDGKVKALAVDHHHGTGKIRGLLCSDCNTGIGKLKDDVNVLSNAIDYLRKRNIDDTN
jgi:hypothetical protein